MQRVILFCVLILISYPAAADSCETLSSVYTLLGDKVIPLPASYFILSFNKSYDESRDIEINEVRLAPLQVEYGSQSRVMPNGLIIREASGADKEFSWEKIRGLGKLAEIKSKKFEEGIILEVYYPDHVDPSTAIFESAKVQIFVSGDDVVCRLKSIVKNRKPLEFLGQ